MENRKKLYFYKNILEKVELTNKADATQKTNTEKEKTKVRKYYFTTTGKKIYDY